MKRKIIFFVMLIALAGLSTLQSCFKDGTIYGTHDVFTDPALVAPLEGVTLHITGTTVDLKWASTNPDSDPVKADVYFGTSGTPPLYKANATALTLTVPVAVGQTYHWFVVMKDANGKPSPATNPPVWSFTIYDPISIFLGSYTCDEPAEGWNYTVNFTKVSESELKIDKYWASWASTFTVNLTTNTYSMPLTDFGGGYWAIESGTINQTTGTLTGTYTIYNPTITTVAETGAHTYTKK